MGVGTGLTHTRGYNGFLWVDSFTVQLSDSNSDSRMSRLCVKDCILMVVLQVYN
jgi:hypothetical protein